MGPRNQKGFPFRFRSFLEGSLESCWALLGCSAFLDPPRSLSKGLGRVGLGVRVRAAAPHSACEKAYGCLKIGPSGVAKHHDSCARPARTSRV